MLRKKLNDCLEYRICTRMNSDFKKKSFIKERLRKEKFA